MRRFSILIVMAIILALFLLNKSGKKESLSISMPKLENSADRVEPQRTIRSNSMKSIRRKNTLLGMSSSSSNAEIIKKFPQKFPEKCRKKDIANYVLEKEVDSNGSFLDEMSSEVGECLAGIGVPKECTTAEKKPLSEYCLNNLILRRAQLIDKLIPDSKSNLDLSEISNKIIAKVYDTDSENDVELLNLVESLLELQPENLEAHQLRAFFAIREANRNHDKNILENGEISAENLQKSTDPKISAQGIIMQFGINLSKWIFGKDENDLIKTQKIAEDYISAFSSDPKGYVMRAIIEGYRDNLSDCKSWLLKGISVGGKEMTGYEDYLNIISSIDNGVFKKETLGLRFDKSETFTPQKILN